MEDETKIIELNEATALLPNDTRCKSCPAEKGCRIAHHYYKATWRFQNPPYSHCPFYLKSYNPTTRKFTIVVLTDKRELTYIPVGFPCIPISELEAQQIVEHRRGMRSKKEDYQAVEQTVGALDLPNERAKSGKQKKGRAVNDDRTPIRAIALHGFENEETQDEIVAKIKELYPERDEKNIRGLVSLYRYHEKRKSKA